MPRFLSATKEYFSVSMDSSKGSDPKLNILFVAVCTQIAGRGLRHSKLIVDPTETAVRTIWACWPAVGDGKRRKRRRRGRATRKEQEGRDIEKALVPKPYPDGWDRLFCGLCWNRLSFRLGRRLSRMEVGLLSIVLCLRNVCFLGWCFWLRWQMAKFCFWEESDSGLVACVSSILFW